MSRPQFAIILANNDKGLPNRPNYPPGTTWSSPTGPALGAGLIAGAILLVAPHGEPYATLNTFSPAILGRRLSPIAGWPLPVTWLAHLGLSVVYALVISRVVSGLRGALAIMVCGLIGLGLYLANWAVVAMRWPSWSGSEMPVVFTHIVFGLVAGGAYRGLQRRKLPVQPPTSDFCSLSSALLPVTRTKTVRFTQIHSGPALRVCDRRDRLLASRTHPSPSDRLSGGGRDASRANGPQFASR